MLHLFANFPNQTALVRILTQKTDYCVVWLPGFEFNYWILLTNTFTCPSLSIAGLSVELQAKEWHKRSGIKEAVIEELWGVEKCCAGFLMGGCRMLWLPPYKAGPTFRSQELIQPKTHMKCEIYFNPKEQIQCML